ncbi:MAG: hypothetical protein RL598_1577, partial [Verrucomicrobiota bacterium]
DARAVNLAKAGGAARYFGNQSGFAKAHLAQPLGEAVITVNHTNSPSGSSGKLAKRQKVKCR